MQLEEYIQTHGQLTAFNKHQHIFRQGQTTGSLYFIQSGLVKAYYLTDNGKEFIKSFITENQVIGSLASLREQHPSPFSLICLEQTSAFQINFKHLYEVAFNDPELNRVMTDALLDLAQKKEKREYEFLCLSAEQRYQQLLKEQPQLPSRITQNDMARYLGVTAVGLSRIKNRDG